MIHAGVDFSLVWGRRRPCSNFLASSVEGLMVHILIPEGPVRVLLWK